MMNNNSIQHSGRLHYTKNRAYHGALFVLGIVGGLRVFFWRNEDVRLIRRKTTREIQPKVIPYGELEDLRVGKTCVYRSNEWWMGPFENPWRCRECVEAGETCKLLPRRNQCRPFHRRDPDVSPRLASSYSPLTRKKSHTKTIRRTDGRNDNGHEIMLIHNHMPDCSASLGLPCFDLNRCSRYGAIKVYARGLAMASRLQKVERQIPYLIHRVHKAQDACLIVSDKDSFRQTKGGLSEMREDEWNHGQNHYIFQSSEIKDPNFHPGMAALSGWGMDDTSSIEGYYTPLVPLPKWTRPDVHYKLDLHRTKRYLLTVRSEIHRWDQYSWQHEWIASEYWPRDDDIHVDIACHSREKSKMLEQPTRVLGDHDVLLNSTFWFFPGRSESNNNFYTFSDVLQGGAIPVVTSAFLPPFAPDVDWTKCIVRVSEARVVDVPELIRSITADEIRIRQRKCANLFEQVFGNPASEDQLFFMAMKVWTTRIKNSLRLRSELDALTFETNPAFSS